MNDHITDPEFMDYAEGMLDTAHTARIDSHLASCTGCAMTLSDLRVWRQALSAEGARIRRAMDDHSPNIERMLQESLKRIAIAAPAGRRSSAREVLLDFRSLLEPVLGRGTVAGAIEIALGRTGTAIESLPAANWNGFVKDVSDAVSDVCGIAAGRLVAAAGASFGKALLAEETT